MWGGEFGRTPTRQLPNASNRFEVPGRDHNNRGFSYWLAGGGVKGGQAYGETDEFGQSSVVGKVHVHDCTRRCCICWASITRSSRTATMAAISRLTDVYGNVVARHLRVGTSTMNSIHPAMTIPNQTSPSPRGSSGDPAFRLGGVTHNTRADASGSLPAADWRREIVTAGALALFAVVGVFHAPASSEGSKLTPQELEFFEKNIRPVLSERCYKCHSTQPDAKVRAGLDLGTREGLMRGGDSGVAVIVGKPADSLLIRSLQGR